MAGRGGLSLGMGVTGTGRGVNNGSVREGVNTMPWNLGLTRGSWNRGAPSSLLFPATGFSTCSVPEDRMAELPCPWNLQHTDHPQDRLLTSNPE
jgi:hypothetical protein